jgi:deazaflavin-dependent oxidoreductase (nitroreductase family)
MTEPTPKSGPPRWVIRGSAPLALAVSGRRWFPLFAVLHHHGRRSGTPYATPIALIPTGSPEIFLIGLPWGRKTNWAANVRAAGGATLTWKGEEHMATEPRLVEPAEAAAVAKPLFRPVVARFPAAIMLKRP